MVEGERLAVHLARHFGARMELGATMVGADTTGPVAEQPDFDPLSNHFGLALRDAPVPDNCVMTPTTTTSTGQSPLSVVVQLALEEI